MDDVSTGELARRLDEVLRTVRDLVGRGEYVEYQRHAEHRFTELERDLEVERAAREAADKETHARMDREVAKQDTNRRQNVFQGYLPSVLVLASIAVSVLLAFRG